MWFRLKRGTLECYTFFFFLDVGIIECILFHTHTPFIVPVGSINYLLLNGKVHNEQGQRQHLPALPMTLSRLLLRSQASRKENRHHPASTPNLPLRLSI